MSNKMSEKDYSSQSMEKSIGFNESLDNAQIDLDSDTKAEYFRTSTK